MINKNLTSELWEDLNELDCEAITGGVGDPAVSVVADKFAAVTTEILPGNIAKLPTIELQATLGEKLSYISSLVGEKLFG